MKYYKAHWGSLLVLMSSSLTVFCLCLAFLATREGGGLAWVGLLLLAMLVGCGLFTVRGYTITPDAILVHRLFWVTRLPRGGLQSAQFEPEAMRRSLRFFGNGGFFSFSGLYRNKQLGMYRAFVTDYHQTVVLRYTGRTVVVSPSLPENFAQELLASKPA